MCQRLKKFGKIVRLLLATVSINESEIACLGARRLSINPSTARAQTWSDAFDNILKMKQFFRRRLLELLVPESFPNKFYRVGREVITNKVDFFKFFYTRKSK